MMPIVGSRGDGGAAGFGGDPGGSWTNGLGVPSSSVKSRPRTTGTSSSLKRFGVALARVMSCGLPSVSVYGTLRAVWSAAIPSPLSAVQRPFRSQLWKPGRFFTRATQLSAIRVSAFVTAVRF
jgi:hypothetical protein